MEGIAKSQRMLVESEAQYTALRGGMSDDERDVAFPPQPRASLLTSPSPACLYLRRGKTRCKHMHRRRCDVRLQPQMRFGPRTRILPR